MLRLIMLFPTFRDHRVRPLHLEGLFWVVYFFVVGVSHRFYGRLKVIIWGITVADFVMKCAIWNLNCQIYGTRGLQSLLVFQFLIIPGQLLFYLLLLPFILHPLQIVRLRLNRHLRNPFRLTPLKSIRCIQKRLQSIFFAEVWSALGACSQQTFLDFSLLFYFIEIFFGRFFDTFR